MLHAEKSFENCSNYYEEYAAAEPARCHFARVLVAGVPFVVHLDCAYDPYNCSDGIHERDAETKIAHDFGSRLCKSFACCLRVGSCVR